MAVKKTLDADSLQDFLLGAVASSGIGSGLPVFWAVGYLVKKAGTSTVQVTLDQLEEMTGYSRSECTAAVKQIRTAGHRVQWDSKTDCTITIDATKGMPLMGPWLTSEEKPQADDLRTIVDYLNQVAGTAFKWTPSVRRQLNARTTSDRMTLEELKHVIDVKCEQWKGDADMEKYMRPSTLFGTRAVEYSQERLKGAITEEKEISREDLGRMWAG